MQIGSPDDYNFDHCKAGIVSRRCPKADEDSPLCRSTLKHWVSAWRYQSSVGLGYDVGRWTPCLARVSRGGGLASIPLDIQGWLVCGSRSERRRKLTERDSRLVFHARPLPEKDHIHGCGRTIFGVCETLEFTEVQAMFRLVREPRAYLNQ